MTIKHETWIACRADYVTGNGSLAALATKHGLKRGSVEKRARKEDWTGLRAEFDQRALEKLLPPVPPSLPPAPMAPDGAISSEWLRQRQELYYRQNSALLDKVRKLLDLKLTEEKELSADNLARLTSALGSLIEAEGKLLGLRDHRRDKRRRPSCDSPNPVADPTPASTP